MFHRQSGSSFARVRYNIMCKLYWKVLKCYSHEHAHVKLLILPWQQSPADKAWEEYIVKHKSIIVDIFQMQLKSRLTCENAACLKVCWHVIAWLYYNIKLSGTTYIILYELIELYTVYCCFISLLIFMQCYMCTIT